MVIKEVVIKEKDKIENMDMHLKVIKYIVSLKPDLNFVYERPQEGYEHKLVHLAFLKRYST